MHDTAMVPRNSGGGPSARSGGLAGGGDFLGPGSLARRAGGSTGSECLADAPLEHDDGQGHDRVENRSWRMPGDAPGMPLARCCGRRMG
jgi:hypothetical protein